MKFQNVIEIQAPITAVFEFVADMRNIPKWNYFVMRVVQESGNGPKLGARYHQTRKTDNQRYEITHYEPVQSLTIQSLPGSSLGFKRHLRFESVVDGTRLIDQMSLRTRYPSILERLGGWGHSQSSSGELRQAQGIAGERADSASRWAGYQPDITFWTFAFFSMILAKAQSVGFFARSSKTPCLHWL